MHKLKNRLCALMGDFPPFLLKRLIAADRKHLSAAYWIANQLFHVGQRQISIPLCQMTCQCNGIIHVDVTVCKHIHGLLIQVFQFVTFPTGQMSSQGDQIRHIHNAVAVHITVEDALDGDLTGSNGTIHAQDAVISSDEGILYLPKVQVFQKSIQPDQYRR